MKDFLLSLVLAAAILGLVYGLGVKYGWRLQTQIIVGLVLTIVVGITAGLLT